MASPMNFSPLEHGADVVVESCAGYIGGFAESRGGFAAGRADLLEKVRAAGTDIGVLGEVQSAAAADRALQTLALRMERHNENAQAVAEFAAAHGAVQRAYYPGLPDHPDNYLAKSILGGFGGVLSFVLKGGDEAARRALQGLRIPRGEAFAGGVASRVWMPLQTEYAQYDEKARAAAGIVPGHLRVSVGLEDFEDLTEDLAQALDAAL
jgi:cystathionine beta-lyase/cystathionine gamma-synthase